MKRSHRFDLIVCLVLAAASILVYGAVFNHQFVNIDDPVYVARNPHVQAGLTPQSIKWAFTTTRAEFWHPLTWLSYMLDTQIFGVQPAGYLLTNLLLHIFSTILVYLIFIRMTGNPWQSAIVAALFGLHPLHVESVAWVAERKDVLSALFWMLTTYAYIHYVDRPGYRNYIAVCIGFILGLMAKPMLVTLPCVLLLLDYWPLGRFDPAKSPAASLPSALRLIREKIPLFIITAVFSLIAFWVQKAGGGTDHSDQYPLTDRIANAVWSYADYIFKTIWPRNLAVFYPFPDHLPVSQVAGAACLLAILTALAFKWARRYPFFIVGWLWYIGTLVPVIGLIKIGDFALADRYMYIPLIGLSIIIAWGLPQILAGLPRKSAALAAVAFVALAGLTLASYGQVRIWTNSFTLFGHALQVTEKNYYAHYGLGHAWAGQGQWDKAASHFLKAVEFNPTKATLRNDLGRVLARKGEFDEAALQLTKAIDIRPQLPSAHFYLANVRVAQNQFERAVYHFSEALKQKADAQATASQPDYHELIATHDTADNINRAVNHYRTLLATNPHDLGALRILAILYAVKGDYDRAFAVLEVDPSPQGQVHNITRGYAGWTLVKSR
jgi:Flp pilus assembly protein TadD